MWNLLNLTFFKTLDDWFFNFDNPEDLNLALKVFKNITYFSEAAFEDRLSNYHRYIQRHLIDSGNDPSNIIVVVPEGGDDSANRHAYSIVKVWKLPQGRVISVRELANRDFQDSIFVAFNDTYGTGRQFLKTVWPYLEKYGSHKTFVVAMTISEAALNTFRDCGMHVPYHMTVNTTAGKLFTGDECKRLRLIGDRVYPKHPMGYGDSAFLTAYHFQCPNNTLPIIWADGQNNESNGQKYPWSALFPYRPKVKSNFEENEDSTLLAQEIKTSDSSLKRSTVYRYRVGLLDIDVGITNLLELASALNKSQSYFYFTAPRSVDLSGTHQSFRKIGGNRYFSLDKIESSFHSQFDELAVDVVGCFTRFALAFFDEYINKVKYNYFSGPSTIDRRFMFVSVDRLRSFSEQAGCSFEEGLVYILVGQLVVFFRRVSYHEETRKCPMDWCGNRLDLRLGLKEREFCDHCKREIEDEELLNSLNQLLRWKSNSF